MGWGCRPCAVVALVRSFSMVVVCFSEPLTRRMSSANLKLERCSASLTLWLHLFNCPVSGFVLYEYGRAERVSLLGSSLDVEVFASTSVCTDARCWSQRFVSSCLLSVHNALTCLEGLSAWAVEKSLNGQNTVYVVPRCLVPSRPSSIRCCAPPCRRLFFLKSMAATHSGCHLVALSKLPEREKVVCRGADQSWGCLVSGLVGV